MRIALFFPGYCGGRNVRNLAGTTMSLILIVLVVLGVALLTAVFIASARTIRRDMNRRMGEFQTRLEDEANAVVDNLLRRAKAEERD